MNREQEAMLKRFILLVLKNRSLLIIRRDTKEDLPAESYKNALRI